MRQFKLTNIIVGWIVFAIAATTYLLTIEPTASYWDCSEFIATSFKLEVGHPPGAPLFMIMGRIASLFASNPAKVAASINSLTALASGFTILFLFWSITHLAKRLLVKKDEEPTLWQIISIMGAGAVGALAYTYSDTFWFSAVEAEVYGTSSLFTAIVFWAILKWENEADKPRANRWIIFIAYMMGLSIGVHLLSLLTIPVIVFVYYFKKFKVTPWGFIGAGAVAVAALAVVLNGIIPWLISFASGFDLFFVNTLGLPFNSGALFYALLLISLLIWSVYYTHKKGKVIANTIMLAISVIIIGYSSFAMVVIRSIANPPLDENSPDNVFALLHYINRDQYGAPPLVYGQYYNAPALDSKDITSYIPENGKYKKAYLSTNYTFDDRFCTFFPRMYSPQSDHIQEYKSWANIQGKPIDVTYNGKTQTLYCPTFGENLKFFFRYQVGFMYFRYFMWNFAGRQNDVQGTGEPYNGNWLSGINAVDDFRLGPQENLPAGMKNPQTRAVYYLLPLLLGLLGVFYQYNKSKRDFWVVLMLFLLTGLAIIVFLNQSPLQPRERDYAYAGSFYAFAIWIGLGILALTEGIKRVIKRPVIAASLATIIGLLAAPTLMAKENWVSHDRSNRYTARDFAYDYLNSCAPNAILFTNGDNDTFPLWYAQEVEGIRTDVRVVNLSLLGTDWYISQMQKQLYSAKPVPFTLPFNKYVQGVNEQLPIVDRGIKGYSNVGDIVNFIASDNAVTKVQTMDGESLDYLPTRNIAIPVDKEKVLENGTVRPEMASQIDSVLTFTIPTSKKYINKPEMMLLDLLAHFGWDRPIYFVSPASDVNIGIQDYLQLDGFAYRLVPIKTISDQYYNVGRIDVDTMYTRMMKTFHYGGYGNPKTFLDYNNVRTLQVVHLKKNFSRLADALCAEGKYDSAKVVMNKCMELTPTSQIPYDLFTLDNIRSLYLAKETEKANKLVEDLCQTTSDNLAYIMNLTPRFKSMYDTPTQLNLYLCTEAMKIAKENQQADLSAKLEKDFQARFARFMQQ